ncbi:MAG: hypothetical protein WC881_11265, partial [Elusimicrobiota bacterium]
MDKIKAVAMTVAIALLPASQLVAAETTGAAFLLIPASPRAYALGKTNVAPTGAQAIGTNPANLGLLSKRFEAFS